MLPSTFEVDHIKPLFSGGSNDLDNLQALCNLCHARKSAQERAPVVIETVRKCEDCGVVYSLYIKHECQRVKSSVEFEQFRYTKKD